MLDSRSILFCLSNGWTRSAILGGAPRPRIRKGTRWPIFIQNVRVSLIDVRESVSIQCFMRQPAQRFPLLTNLRNDLRPAHFVERRGGSKVVKRNTVQGIDAI